MPFAENNDVIKTIPSDRADEPLRISVLRWRACRDRPSRIPIARTRLMKASPFAEAHAVWGFGQHVQLMPEDQDFSLQCRPAT